MTISLVASQRLESHVLKELLVNETWRACAAHDWLRSCLSESCGAVCDRQRCSDRLCLLLVVVDAILSSLVLVVVVVERESLLVRIDGLVARTVDFRRRRAIARHVGEVAALVIRADRHAHVHLVLSQDARVVDVAVFVVFGQVLFYYINCTFTINKIIYENEA